MTSLVGCITRGIFFNNAWCSCDFIMPCTCRNPLTRFISLKFSSPPCPWQPKFWNYNGGQKIKFQQSLNSWVWMMRLDESISNLLTPFWRKMGENLQNRVFYQFSTVFFLSKREVNVIRFQFWDQIWNPLINMHFIDPKMKEKLQLYFLTSHCNFKTLVTRGRVGMKILEKWNMPLCFRRYRAW